MKRMIDNMPPGRKEEIEKCGNKFKLTTYELVKLKIDRLMAEPDKPIIIPEMDHSNGLKPPPEFVRNVWGSAAGVGSGDFHIYRGIRRREYARQEYLDKKAEEEAKDADFLKKIEELKRMNREKTAKKRDKRLKKRALQSKRAKRTNSETLSSKNTSTDESEVEEVELVE